MESIRGIREIYTSNIEGLNEQIFFYINLIRANNFESQALEQARNILATVFKIEVIENGKFQIIEEDMRMIEEMNRKKLEEIENQARICKIYLGNLKPFEERLAKCLSMNLKKFYTSDYENKMPREIKFS
jgi:hypothetical protein